MVTETGKQQDLISVIIPVYNVELYLKECISSVCHQTYRNLQILCVDDGSTDNSAAILSECAAKDQRITVITKSNGGYGSAINAGLNAAEGRYVSVVESDDFIDSTMLEKLLNLIKKTDSDIAKCGYCEYYGENKIIKLIRFKRETGYTFNIKTDSELLRHHPSIWSCLYKRDFLARYAIKMNEAEGAGWVDNPFFFETICQAESIAWLNEALYFYRQTSGNSSHLKDCSIPLDRMSEIYAIIDEICPDNQSVHFEADKRLLLYVGKIMNNPNLKPPEEERARRMIQEHIKDYKLLSYNELKVVKRFNPETIDLKVQLIAVYNLLKTKLNKVYRSRR